MAARFAIGKWMILASIFVTAAVVADPSVEQSQSEIQSLGRATTVLNRRIEVLEATQKTQADLEFTMKTAERVVQFLTVVITAVSILLTVVTIAVPIVFYFQGRSNRKAFEALVRAQRKQFESFLNSHQEELRKSAIRDIQSAEGHLKRQALTFLALNQHQPFSDEELGKLYLAIDNLDGSQRPIVLLILTARENVWATRYFKQDEITDANVYYALRYAETSRSDTIWTSIRNYILAEPFDAISRFSIALNYSRHLSHDLLLRLLNDTPLLDGLCPGTVFSAGRNLQATMKNDLELQVAVARTELGLRNNRFGMGEHVTFWAGDGQTRYEVFAPSVDGFNMFRVYKDGELYMEVGRTGGNRHLFDGLMEKYG